MGIFNDKVKVGPLLYWVYEQVNSAGKATIKKYVRGASTKHEIVGVIPSIKVDVAQEILSLLQMLEIGKNSVAGAVDLGYGFIIYVTGDFPDSISNDISVLFAEFAQRANVEPKILRGKPTKDQLKELA